MAFTHPPLKVDRMRHGPTKPKNGSKMVRFGSADLWASALGVKRVRGSVSPWSRDRPKPKKAPNCQQNFAPDRYSGDLFVRSIFRRSILRVGCVSHPILSGRKKCSDCGLKNRSGSQDVQFFTVGPMGSSRGRQSSNHGVNPKS